MRRIRIATVVEGHGEVSALPVLLRRLAGRLVPDVALELPRPYRVGRQTLLAPGGVETAVAVALPPLFPAVPSGPPGAVMILIDADDDCPAQLGPEVLARARTVLPHAALSAVVAKREFEAWFLAGAPSLSGKRGLAQDLVVPPEPEKPRDCKGWLTAHRTDRRPYKPAADQAALAAAFDVELARGNSPSLDKLCRDVERLLHTASA